MTLKKALSDYRAVLLETAAGDLLARQAGLPRPNAEDQARDMRAITHARSVVLAEASKLTSDRFITELMVANFMGA